MSLKINISNYELSEKNIPFIVCELSGNHQGSKDSVKELIHAAAQTGAHAVKLQTYKPETLTLKSDKECFRIKGGLWDNRYLHDLYAEGMTPWEWHPELKEYAESLGLVFFSTPFDETAVDFLEEHIDPPTYKIASYEVTHLPLLKKIGELKKPVIMSTGMATEEEIRRAVSTLKNAGSHQIIILKCISEYPANPATFNLRSMCTLRKQFNCLSGLSDHTKTHEIALGATALGACVIEKHMVLKRENDTIDAGFSLEPHEFKQMVDQVKILHTALGSDVIGPNEKEQSERNQRRSIFISANINTGDPLTRDNIRVVRPALGLCPSLWETVLGKKATRPLFAGDPLNHNDWC